MPSHHRYILVILFFVTLSVGKILYSQTTDSKLEKSLIKVEQLLESKNYFALWKFSKKALDTYPKEKLFHYGYACGLYFSRDHKRVKKEITSDPMFWKEVTTHLDKSKPLELYDKKFSTSIQKEYYKLASQELADGKLTKALHYYTWWFDFFDNSDKAYQNKFDDKVQDSVFSYSKRQYLAKNTAEADKGFNWIYKTFYQSNFEFKYDGSLGFDDSTYQFDEYHNPKFILANTAMDADYLTKEEKQLIYLVNLVRMDSKLFITTYIEVYKKHDHWNDNNYYYSSLLEELNETVWRKIIYPDEKLFDAAEFHAIDMGINGLIGHTSSDGTGCFTRIKRFGGNGHAENCSYGLHDPMQILMQLLIDSGIESLGHRKNILNPGSGHLGTAIREHSTFGTNCVMDFGP